MSTGCKVPRRIPAPPPGKIRVATADIPAWRYTFSVPDDFDLEHPTPEELCRAYGDWLLQCHEWDDVDETPSLDELLNDAAAMADTPWDPATDPP